MEYRVLITSDAEAVDAFSLILRGIVTVYIRGDL